MIFSFGSSIPTIIYLFMLFIISIADFSTPNSILVSWKYILIACIWVRQFFLNLFANSLISSMYIRRLILFCALVILSPVLCIFKVGD